MTEALFSTAPYSRDCVATVIAAYSTGIRLDRTIFYPMGGGQPGDTGQLILPDGGPIGIVDTRKGDVDPDDILHIPAADAVLPPPGTIVTAVIDWVERGTAPDSLVASKIVSGEVTRSRPLCPYPQVARYRGQGSTEVATSFECRMP